MSMKNFMPKSKWRVRKQQRGIVVIEAVIILPVVLFLILAVAEQADQADSDPADQIPAIVAPPLADQLDLFFFRKIFVHD